MYLYTDVSNAIRDLFLVIAARKGIKVFWMYIEGERLIYYNKGEVDIYYETECSLQKRYIFEFVLMQHTIPFKKKIQDNLKLINFSFF